MSSTVELYRSNSDLLNNAIDRLIVDIYTYKRKYNNKSLLLSGCATQSGTTMIAINLVVSLAMSGWKTLLVDCDLRKGSLLKRLNKDTEYGLSDYLTDKIQKEDLIQKTNYKNLSYIPSGTTVNSPIRLLCSSKMESLLQEVSEGYDYIIYDFPSINVVSDANIFMQYMDGIMLVASLGHTTKKQLEDAKIKISKCTKHNYYGLILNQVNLNEYKKYINDYDYFEIKNLNKRYLNNIKRRKSLMDDERSRMSEILETDKLDEDIYK
jgi:capsular exopolysaccharide synthesis family protein